jgi:hypothetical protein
MAYEGVKNARGTALPWIWSNYPDFLKGLNSKPNQNSTGKTNKKKKKIIKIMNLYEKNYVLHLDYESIFVISYTGNSNNCTLVHDSSIKPLGGLMYWRQSNQLSNSGEHI